MQCHRPGAAQAIAKRGVCGLEGVVPVAMAIGGQRRAGNDAFLDQREGALRVLPDGDRFSGVRATRIEERHALVEHCAIAGSDEILSEHHQRPEHDVAVRVAGTNVPLALEEHEPLRPITVGILLPHDPQQHVAYRLHATQGEQQFDRSLADIARAPAASGVLLEASRRQVVHERIVCEPRDDVRDTGERLLQRARLRSRHGQCRNDAFPRLGKNRCGETFG